MEKGRRVKGKQACLALTFNSPLLHTVYKARFSASLHIHNPTLFTSTQKRAVKTTPKRLNHGAVDWFMLGRLKDDNIDIKGHDAGKPQDTIYMYIQHHRVLLQGLSVTGRTANRPRPLRP